ncbi:Cytochrome bd-I ubiquinol oxidase subunit 1 [Chlamydia avium]|uniref:Bacterial Cytochrome Ubiquinol Oxidase family protein n=1 Tax=Chlamydia avium TaxID=1457141 RepID=A0ABN0MS56_9CHLA|nr:cytochrome ubiquinol oxidase subunit I [Chlamydia avium]EPP37378.1 bacterial Cytochrome Ubiquinol Oxidase family protein [Chlamydia psittaci 10_743_SC13]EPP38272.1 bacterial Cytochrome Ubiquinol Oxidase family protein [Chlamydia avium]VVT42909.1 Cytochrome bd-I ubiquinol oxidase subunit 1 [Chlamydia avium]
MDALMLSRIQFGLFISFHYLFVPLSMGISMMLVVMGGLHLITKKNIYKQMTWFWTDIFALTFVVGVVTGIMQIFSFGSNWSRFSEYTGNIFGTLLGSEGIFAFFLESGFLGVLLFGRHKVSKNMYFFATCMVALGAHMSAFWIVCANSWMQTPSGYSLVMQGGQLIPSLSSFREVVFSPSSISRFIHVVLGTWLSGIFLVISVSAFYLRKKRNEIFARQGIKLGAILGIVVLILQLWSADVSARGVARNQPAKLAAFEGIFKTEEYTPIYLFGVVDVKNQKVFGLRIPGALSFLVHRNIKTPVTGLDQIPREEWPNVAIVFQLYHLMVMLWGVMVILACVAWCVYKNQRWAMKSWILFILSLSIFCPEICNEVGWCATEIGRQPWVVYGLLKTKDAISPIIQKGQVIQSLALFSLVFIFLLSLFIFLLCQKIQRGPDQNGFNEVEI